MSVRARSARKSTASTFSYAEPASSADEDEGIELDDEDRGGGGRKSKTKALTKRRKSKAKAVEVDSGDEGDEDDQPRKKPRGSAKRKQSKQKKGTGKLEILKTLPIEMLTEIFSHLYPNDLLALSMVNKQYRALLIAKSSTRLWKTARDKLELPDVVTDYFTEVQYASLIFERNCQLCGINKYASVEPRLRIRYCKSCRTKEVVELSSLKRLHPDVVIQLHSRAQDVVLISYGRVLLSDLYRATVILRDLEVQDEDSDIAQGNVDRVTAPAQPSSSSSRRRSSRKRSSKTWAPRYKDESDGEDDSASPYTRRVNEYVVARASLCEEISKHALDIQKASEVAKKHLQRAKWHGPARPAVEYDPDREATLQKKIIELGLGYSEADFYFCRWYSSKLVRSPDPLTDEEWIRIKPKLIKLLDLEKDRYAKAQAVLSTEIDRQNKQTILRPFYDKLLKSMPRSARPFAPLYLDFLLLPSVKPLWVGNGNLSEQAWLDALDGIKDDLEQFRLDLVSHAHSIILEATTDPAEDLCALDDDELPADLDEFFSLATSFVCCDFGYCRRPTKYEGWFPYFGRVRREYRKFGSIGPLVTVLEHLHEHHNRVSTIYGDRAVTAQPQFHFSLPLEVACAVSALLEVNQLDPSTADVAELERAGQGVRKYAWENHSSRWRNYSGECAWFELLHAVKKEGDKLARLKPPAYLDPPVVVMHPVRGFLAAADDSDDQQEQLGEGSESE